MIVPVSMEITIVRNAVKVEIKDNRFVSLRDRFFEILMNMGIAEMLLASARSANKKCWNLISICPFPSSGEKGKLLLSQKNIKQHRESNGPDEPPFMPVQKFQHCT
jgi:hypothetical protein